MNNNFAKTVLLGFAALLLSVGGSAYADDMGYLNSAGGVVKSGFDLCWQTSAWTPEKQTVECGAEPEPEPEPEPPAPEPEPEPAPEPEPQPQTVSFSADTLFEFDKAVLRPGGERELDNFVTKLNGVDYDTVKVIGHTDRIGSEAYNMDLSKRRAESVESYLVTRGVPDHKISSEGRGESEPVTTEAECSGKKLIPCYQPDRRVEVEVTGQKLP